MTENINDQHSQQSNNNFVQQSTQHSSHSDRDKINIKIEEIEEWDVVMTDQRRPQFRFNENYGRKNY